MKFTERFYLSVLRKVINFALKVFPYFSDSIIIKGSYLADFFAGNQIAKDTVKFIRQLYKQKHPALSLTRRILKEIAPECRKKIANNLIINAMLLGTKKRDKYFAQTKVRPPFLILFSPTMRCNLNCEGCYAAKYTREEELSYETISKVIYEAKEMGIYFFTILGGEPFIRTDLFELYREHSDAYFQVYTNGTLINTNNAKKLADLGNVIPIISLEGCEGATDSRRGQGIFQKVISAMRNLRTARVPFGNSVTVSKDNFEAITSENFIDFLIKEGSLIIWYFLFMPVGEKPDIKKMPSAEQRNKLRIFTREIRNSKPIFVADFWNDAPYVGGCIAGGRRYFHINHKGEVEPCIFAHFAVDNIKNKSLKEVINSQFFQAIRKKQPFSNNLLMPCMLIDNPEIFRQVIRETGAYPTHNDAEYLISELATFLDEYAEKQREVLNKVWEEEYYEKSSWWRKNI